jgi:ABC-type glutathione transport system ATPase component
MNEDILLAVEDLEVEFATAHGLVPALRGVSFAMNRGEVLGIVGESGSGKTVACRAVMRLLSGRAPRGDPLRGAGHAEPRSPGRHARSR